MTAECCVYHGILRNPPQSDLFFRVTYPMLLVGESSHCCVKIWGASSWHCPCSNSKRPLQTWSRPLIQWCRCCCPTTSDGSTGCAGGHLGSSLDQKALPSPPQRPCRLSDLRHWPRLPMMITVVPPASLLNCFVSAVRIFLQCLCCGRASR